MHSDIWRSLNKLLLNFSFFTMLFIFYQSTIKLTLSLKWYTCFRKQQICQRNSIRQKPRSLKSASCFEDVKFRNILHQTRFFHLLDMIVFVDFGCISVFDNAEIYAKHTNISFLPFFLSSLLPNTITHTL